MDTKIPELLRSLAGEVPAGTPNEPRLARATLRRARRRRALTASGTMLTVTALVLGGLLGVRAVRPSSGGVTPAGSPSPSAVAPAAPAFEGVWPETTPAELATAQQAVDEGHQPWRLDPGQTAVALATNLLGWSYDATSSNVVQLADSRATVRISNSAFGPRVPPITVALRQLDRVGPTGVWTVVKAGSPILDVQVSPYPLRAGADATVTGHLTEAFDASTVRVDLLAGPTLESSIAGGARPLAPAFDWTGPVPSGSLEDVTVLVRNVDATGMAIAASAFAVPVLDPNPPPVRGP
ncbi:MAG: hypothetical protein ACE14W_09195 [Candidatus Velamenicoccus archaeovorus]